MFNSKEISRYNRHLILPGFGTDGQQKLKSASVLVVGAGGLGSPVLLYLAAAGIGTIGIIDGDIVDLSNLQRQVLFDIDDIGNNKALVAAKKLASLNDQIQVIPYSYSLEFENCREIIKQYDVVVDCTDNFPARYLINDACRLENKPFVSGSIEHFEGQVSVFNFLGGPDYRSIFPEPPADSLNCNDNGVLGVLPGIIGSIQASEVLKILTGIGETLSGKLLLVNALNMEFSTLIIPVSRKNDPVELVDSGNILCDKINEITLEELKKLQESEYLLIDIREIYEFEEKNIGGINVPMDTLLLTEKIDAEGREIIICCGAGNKSKSVIPYLTNKFPGVKFYSLKGGINS